MMPQRKKVIAILLVISLVVLIPVSAFADTTVYITKTGKKYHYTTSCSGLRNANSVSSTSLGDAQSKGYEACAICAGGTPGSSGGSGSGGSGTSGAFKDMTGNNEFDTAITWAANAGITTGWSDGTFRPYNTCNRASVVTFLWRMAGKPNPSTKATFKDMTGNSDFDKAISWALEEGITTGWSDNTFRPWNTCNRAAIVTFLWRYAEKPGASKTAGFKDMTGNSDFDKAISWAAEEGITTGWSDNTFRPWRNCNRMAIAAFLYRFK